MGNSVSGFHSLHLAQATLPTCEGKALKGSVNLIHYPFFVALSHRYIFELYFEKSGLHGSHTPMVP
jgi:hypothetical protein